MDVEIGFANIHREDTSDEALATTAALVRNGRRIAKKR
jgi:hypothetical protein